MQDFLKEVGIFLGLMFVGSFVSLLAVATSMICVGYILNWIFG